MTARQPSLFEEPPKENGRRLQFFAECASAIDKLFRDSLDSEGKSAFAEFIDFARRLSNLSVYNAMLVRLQRPGALAVATEKRWLKMDRFVKPGAIPIVILRPFGPVSFLYEISDTDGGLFFGEDETPFKAVGDIDEVDWGKVLKHHREKNRIQVEEKSFGAALAGNARNLQLIPSRPLGSAAFDWLVQLNINHDIPTRFATLAHELGHIFCGHCGGDAQGRWPDRSKLKYGVREVEAEAVSYLASSRKGLSVASKDYLSALIQEVDLREVSLYAIFEAANRVEGKLNEGK